MVGNTFWSRETRFLSKACVYNGTNKNLYMAALETAIVLSPALLFAEDMYMLYL